MELCCSAHCPALFSLHKKTRKKSSFIDNLPPARPCKWVSLSIWWKEDRKDTHILSIGEFLDLQALHYHCHQLPLNSVCRRVLILTGISCTFSSDASSLAYARQSRWQWKYTHLFHIPCKYKHSINNLVKQLFFPNILFPRWLCYIIPLITPVLLITQVLQSLSFTSSKST